MQRLQGDIGHGQGDDDVDQKMTIIMEGNPYHSICPIHDAMYSGFSHHLYFYVHKFLRIAEVIHWLARSS